MKLGLYSYPASSLPPSAQHSQSYLFLSLLLFILTRQLSLCTISAHSIFPYFIHTCSLHWSLVKSLTFTQFNQVGIARPLVFPLLSNPYFLNKRPMRAYFFHRSYLIERAFGLSISTLINWFVKWFSRMCREHSYHKIWPLDRSEIIELYRVS